ncbi:MAG: histidine phosphatase family protein [Planctomycetaceae bacterium]|nr:histidine phosphatase family protein [Planctomycetaceae bacterium]
MQKEVYLLRHAEPETAYTKRFLGRLDPGLSPTGVEQATLAGRRLREFRPQAIIASPLRRASETAAIVADACCLAVQTDPDLIEIDFGDLEGLTFAEASERYPGITDSWQALAGDFSFPGGERFIEFNRRCCNVASRIRSCPEERVALVAHGGVLRGILCNLLAVEADGPLRFRLAYAALTTVELDTEGGAVLTGFNIGRTDQPRPPVE